MRCGPARARGRAASAPARRQRSGRRPARWRRGGDERDALVGEVAEQPVEPARLEAHVGVDEGDERRVDRASPALRATAGPALVRSRNTRDPATDATGGSDASSTAITPATPAQQRTISASADSPSTKAGTTTVTSAAVNGPHGRPGVDGAGVDEPVGEPRRRALRRDVGAGGDLVDNATPASLRRNRRSGDPPMTTLLPRRTAGRAIERRTSSRPPVLPHRRRRGSRSPVSLSRMAHPRRRRARSGRRARRWATTPCTPSPAAGTAITSERCGHAGRRPLEADEVRAHRQHQRRLGAPGVGVAARRRTATRGARRDPRGRASARPVDGVAVAAVAVDEHDAGRPVGAADELDDHRRRDLGADRQRAGEAGVLAAGRHGERRADDDVGAASASPAARASAMIVSVSNGRCGPCCSHDPTGMHSSGRPSASDHVISVSCTWGTVTRRRPRPTGRP